MTTRQKGFDYLSLPPELRNQVMEYALVPGNVYPKKPSRRPTRGFRESLWRNLGGPKFTKLIRPTTHPAVAIPFPLAFLINVFTVIEYFRRRSKGKLRLWFVLWEFFAFFILLYSDRARPACWEVNQLIDAGHYKLPGYQLLAACEQTQEEGERLFYEKNTFHLPPGQLKHTLDWLYELQPWHEIMIKSVCITLSSADLTPSILTKIDKVRKEEMSEPGFSEERFLRRIIYDFLNEIWAEKLRFLARWRTLDTIHVRGIDHRFSIQPWEIPAVTLLTDWPEYRSRFWNVHLELQFSMRHGGWKRTKARLTKCQNAVQYCKM